MKVHFRTYCQGCRYGRRWTSGRCVWPAHRWDWDYYIECDGRRLVQRGGFHSFGRAWDSAQRSWFKLTAVRCLTGERAGDDRCTA